MGNGNRLLLLGAALSLLALLGCAAPVHGPHGGDEVIPLQSAGKSDRFELTREVDIHPGSRRSVFLDAPDLHGAMTVELAGGEGRYTLTASSGEVLAEGDYPATVPGELAVAQGALLLELDDATGVDGQVTLKVGYRELHCRESDGSVEVRESEQVDEGDLDGWSDADLCAAFEGTVVEPAVHESDYSPG